MNSAWIKHWLFQVSMPTFSAFERHRATDLTARGIRVTKIKGATKKYEAWLKRHTTVIESDVELKHTQMCDALFPFLRATFQVDANLAGNLFRIGRRAAGARRRGPARRKLWRQLAAAFEIDSNAR
jgi:hypothetical protein